MAISDGDKATIVHEVRAILAQYRAAVPPVLVERLFLTFLYLAGIAHWLRSFWFAKLTGLDWRLTLVYQGILKEALTSRQIPYASTFNHYTNRFLGSPETPLSPQFLLVPWLDPWTFYVLNILALYTISFAGLLLIRRRYGLTWLPFTFLFLLFSFNGCIVPRVAVGHTMWYGYFLLPYFYYCLMDILEGRNVKRATYLLAGVMFLMELQGSFHIFVWCSMFLGFVAVFSVKRFVPIVVALFWAYALCTFRYAPSAVSLYGTPLEYIEDFPTLGLFLDGLTVRPKPAWIETGRYFGWPEMDCYVGFVGLAVLVGFGWVYPYRRASGRIAGHGALYPACLAMVAMSLSPVWEHVFNTGIPLLSSQRIPARFSVIPVTATIFLAAPRMQRYLNDAATPKWVSVVLILALYPLVAGLNAHSRMWTISTTETLAWSKKTSFLPVSLIPPNMQDPSDRLYVYTLWASTAFSIVVAACWLGLLLRQLRKDAKETQSIGFRVSASTPKMTGAA